MRKYEITLWHECSPLNLLHIFRTLFPKNTCVGLLLYLKNNKTEFHYYMEHILT